MIRNKTIALIAHDARKTDMMEWVKYNVKTLANNQLVCTGTTGSLVEKVMKEYTGKLLADHVKIIKKKSGPMGGDAQIAAMVVEGAIDLCVFLIDDLTANPHEADIQMLLRQCRLHNIPVACNRSSADMLITSALWGTNYEASEPTYTVFERK